MIVCYALHAEACTRRYYKGGKCGDGKQAKLNKDVRDHDQLSFYLYKQARSTG